MNMPDRYEKSPKKFTNGGMATALLFRDKHLDREVIIKVLHSNTEQKRLIDEVKALGAVRSKHVVEIYDVIKNNSGKIRAVVVEYVPGDDLSSKLGKCSTDEVLRIAFAIASGLSDIHRVGQIHRDIKPENMKFDAEGCLKIFDFGLSRTEELDAKTSGAVGTLGYLAPELCVADDEDVTFSQAVDIYAFASTILALINGSIPKPMRAIPPKLPCAAGDFSKQKITLPESVSTILNQCFTEDPTERPSIDQVLDIISLNLLEGQHRASLVVGGKVYNLHSGNKSVKVNSGNLGSFDLTYNGFIFTLNPTGGYVYINNVITALPIQIPGSCVVTLGPPSAGLNRAYVPVDVSHPEVLI
jgi:serine/threonine-protein kinase